MSTAQKSQTAEVVALQEPRQAEVAFDLPKNKIEIVGEACESCSA